MSLLSLSRIFYHKQNLKAISRSNFFNESPNDFPSNKQSVMNNGEHVQTFALDLGLALSHKVNNRSESLLCSVSDLARVVYSYSKR